MSGASNGVRSPPRTREPASADRDRHQPPDIADHDVVAVGADHGSEIPRGIDRQLEQRLRSSRGHDDGLRPGGDCKPVDDIALLRGRDGHDPIGDQSEGTLSETDRAVDERVEIAFEHVAVVRVDDEAAAPARTRGVVQERREPAQGARLGGMGVNDVGRLAKYGRDQRDECPEIVRDADAMLEMPMLNGCDAALDRRGRQRCLVSSDDPVDEKRLVATRLQAGIQQGHVARGPADVEASDDPEDFHERPIEPAGCTIT